MTKKIYKYLGEEVLDLVFKDKSYVGFKCSKPKDYNDPYELFLSIDRSLEPEYLAAYQEFVDDLPQLPTSCFSKSPVVVPMWAHYANTAKGFVVEIDEDKLKEHYDEVLFISDVTYSNQPSEHVVPSLLRAVGTCKPRHTFFLHKTIFHAAYFYKQSEWAYEQERRVVVHDDGIVENINGNVILNIPVECVTAIICGENTEKNNSEIASGICKKSGFNFYRSFIGRSYAKKIMIDQEGQAHVFDGDELIVASTICSNCKEPFDYVIESNKKLCSWCSITDLQRYDAALKNPYRILDHAGMLENHIQGMIDISKGLRK